VTEDKTIIIIHIGVLLERENFYGIPNLMYLMPLSHINVNIIGRKLLGNAAFFSRTTPKKNCAFTSP
jgi:hypothetical protein